MEIKKKIANIYEEHKVFIAFSAGWVGAVIATYVADTLVSASQYRNGYELVRPFLKDDDENLVLLQRLDGSLCTPIWPDLEKE